MPAILFEPPIAPSPGSQHSKTLKILEAEFGDGYSQPTPDGLNHIRRESSIVWGGLTTPQKQEIDDFFTALGGTKPFRFHVFGDTVERQWRCKEWSFDSEAGYWKGSATFVQDFRIVP